MKTKTIVSAVVIVLAAVLGYFIGAGLGERTNDAFAGAILFAVIAGFVCVIYAIENSGKK